MCCCVWAVWCIFLPFFFFFFFLNCLYIILLNSCNKAVVSNLIKWCFHPSGFNKAVSCSYCEAEDLLWLFMFARLALTEYHLWSDDDYKLPIVELLVLGVLLIDLGLGPLHQINSCTLWLCVYLCERWCVIVKKTDKLRLHLKAVRTTLMLTVA